MVRNVFSRSNLNDDFVTRIRFFDPKKREAVLPYLEDCILDLFVCNASHGINGGPWKDMSCERIVLNPYRADWLHWKESDAKRMRGRSVDACLCLDFLKCREARMCHPTYETLL